MSLPTKRFAALLVAGVALAPTMAGCGQSDPTKAPSQGAGTPSTPEPAATVAVLPDAIDYNDRTELAAALQALGVETPPMEPAGTERSVVTGVAFPTWPTGEIRKAGLDTFRIDVSHSYDGKGYIKFSQGKKELYTSAAFNPSKVTTVQKIPANVLESLKAGDKVTWGLYFDNKRQKPITVDFTVTEKAPATKKVAALEANKGLSELGRMIAKAQALKNYSFLSEALVTYVNVIEADESINSVYADIVDCLRRLKLKNTPLFEHAQLRMTSSASPARKAFGGLTGGSIAGGGPSSADVPSGGPGKMAPIGPTKVGKTGTGSGKSGFTQGGTGISPPASATPDATPDAAPVADTETTGGKTLAQLAAAARARKEAASKAREHADFAAKAAADAKKAADKAQAEANGKAAKAAALQAQAEAARDQANDPNLTPEERQAAMQEAGNLDAQAAEMRAAAELAAAVAGEKRLHADNLANDATKLDREADIMEQNANTPGLPGSGPTSDPMAPAPLPQLNPAQQLAAAQALVQAAQSNVASAEQRVVAAKAAVQAAIGGTPAQKMAAANELEAAKAALEAATAAAHAANEALGNLQQGS